MLTIKFIPWNLEDITNVKIEHFVFEQVKNIKYLGVNINHRNNMHSKVKQRTNATDRTYSYFAI